MKGEMGAEVTLDRLPYSLARRTEREWAAELDRQSGVEVLLRGPTASGSRCSPTPGGWAGPSATSPTPCSRPSSRRRSSA